MESGVVFGHDRGMFRFLPPCLAAICLCSCASGPQPKTAASVDLARYAGDWYEVESSPNPFQRGCTDTRASYRALPDGKIAVTNSCMRKGHPASIKGVARVVPGSNNTKLRVRFFWPFEGDYWVIAVDPDYRWAAVGHPNRKYQWILSRKPTLDAPALQRARAALAAQGFDTNLLRATPQTAR